GLDTDRYAVGLDDGAVESTTEECFAIMRDGRIGGIGSAGLILSWRLRYAGMEALPEPIGLPVLLCMPAMGRWAMVVGAVAAPYARAEGGLAEPFLRHLTARHLLVATACLGAALLGMLGIVGALAGLVVAALVARAVTAQSRRLCGGITGDTLGATSEAAEIAFLLLGPLLVRAG